MLLQERENPDRLARGRTKGTNWRVGLVYTTDELIRAARLLDAELITNWHPIIKAVPCGVMPDGRTMVRLVTFPNDDPQFDPDQIATVQAFREGRGSRDLGSFRFLCGHRGWGFGNELWVAVGPSIAARAAIRVRLCATD